MKKAFYKFTILAALTLGTVGVSACATNETQTISVGDVTMYDPYEDYNRTMFKFNNAVDDAVIHPIAKGYNTVLPSPVRTGVTNVLRNLRSPVDFSNQVLQGDAQGAHDVAVRAVVNTMVGGAGLFDVAAYEGIPYEFEDFGQTLAVWGVPHGPYLVVPIIGPSSARDYFGFFVDSYLDPLRWYLFNIDEEGIYYGKVGLQYLNLRASLVDVLEDLENSSIDYYAATRSAYYQQREALVNDQDSGEFAVPDIPDYDDE